MGFAASAVAKQPRPTVKEAMSESLDDRRIDARGAFGPQSFRTGMSISWHPSETGKRPAFADVLKQLTMGICSQVEALAKVETDCVQSVGLSLSRDGCDTWSGYHDFEGVRGSLLERVSASLSALLKKSSSHGLRFDINSDETLVLTVASR